MSGGDTERFPFLPDDLFSLGEPEQVHPMKPVVRWLCALTGLLAFGPAALCFVCAFKPFGHNPPPPAVALGVGAAFALAGLAALAAALWYRGATYLVFRDALVELRGRGWKVFRWGEIKELYDARLPLAHECRLATEDGRTLALDRLMRDRAALIETIATRVTDRQLPEATREFDAGRLVRFGALTVSRAGILYQGRALPWANVADVGVRTNGNDRALQVLETRAGRPWCSLSVRKVPNLRVLEAVVARARGGSLPFPKPGPVSAGPLAAFPRSDRGAAPSPLPTGAGLPFPSPARARPAQRNRLQDTLSALAVLAVLAGPLLFYITSQRQKILQRGRPTPQVVTAADLDRGPGHNIHVKLTDFEFGEHYVVAEKRGSWTAVTIPAFPRGREGDPKALKVLVRTTTVKNEAQLQEFCRHDTVRGVIVNGIFETGNDVAFMGNAYPGSDPSAMLVIQEGMTFPTRHEIQTMYYIASGLIGLGVCCGVLALAAKRGPV